MSAKKTDKLLSGIKYPNSLISVVSVFDFNLAHKNSYGTNIKKGSSKKYLQNTSYNYYNSGKSKWPVPVPGPCIISIFFKGNTPVIKAKLVAGF